MSKLTDVGRYQLLRRLATGGMGDIFLARQRSTVAGFSRLVAIKLLLPHYSSNQAFVSMFLEEARVVGKLHHKNIVQIVDVDSNGDQYFIVMEYIPGQNLRELLGDATIVGRPIFHPQLAANLFADIAGALAAAHATGLVHRDVTPNNIMVADSGVPKLIDFGVAKAAEQSSMTSPGTLKGKFGYMAPEYVKGQAYDARADIFSLGVVMWETLCRQRLFRGGNAAAQLQQLLEQPIQPVTSVVEGIPLELSVIVEKALARDPNERFATAEQMHDALQNVAAKLPVGPDRDLEAWVQRNVGGRIEERRRVDNALMNLPIDAPVPMFDDPIQNPGNLPNTFGAFSGSHVAHLTNHGMGGMMQGMRTPGGVVQLVMPPPSNTGSKRAALLIGVSAVAGLLAAAAFLLSRGDNKANAAATAPTAQAQGVQPQQVVAAAPSAEQQKAKADAEVFRKEGLKALSERDYATAHGRFVKAMEMGGASEDLSELVRLANQLREEAATKALAVKAPPATTVAAIETPQAQARDDDRPAKGKNNRKPEPARRQERVAPSKPTPASTPSETKPANGDLIVTSSPPRLTVTVDGSVVGQTPLRMGLTAGTHNVSVIQNGSVVRQTSVSITSGGTAVVNAEGMVAPTPQPTPALDKSPTQPQVAATPKPPAATVAPTPAVATQPAKPAVASAPAAPSKFGEAMVLSPNVLGDVYVNGVNKGPAPMVVKNLPIGKTKIEIRVGGATRRSKVVNILEAERASVRFE